MPKIWPKNKPPLKRAKKRVWWLGSASVASGRRFGGGLVVLRWWVELRWFLAAMLGCKEAGGGGGLSGGGHREAGGDSRGGGGSRSGRCREANSGSRANREERRGAAGRKGCWEAATQGTGGGRGLETTGSSRVGGNCRWGPERSWRW
ncbi:glycine-rich cell wall structural protein 1.0-like [Cryptomeria japonica]|uniref:glycine-rich cell wall structural protein 1.0-like n=1 Tax=Cryptomeria japonica TaxID=3369 RepID=UPI0027DA3F75|nr:glycine-rich cell wall structural protein 1.0-like [Cryptomeria japonica]